MGLRLIPFNRDAITSVCIEIKAWIQKHYGCRGLKKLICFFWRNCLTHQVFKPHPPILENPYVLSGLSRYRLDVQHMSIPGREQTAHIPRRDTGILWSMKFLPFRACHAESQTLWKTKLLQSNTPPWGSEWALLQVFLSLLLKFRAPVCSSAVKMLGRRLIKAMTPLKSRPIAVCFSICWHSWFLHFAICQISRRADGASLFSAGRLMQQVYEICLRVMDHCRLRLCFVRDKSRRMFGVRSKELTHFTTVS